MKRFVTLRGKVLVFAIGIVAVLTGIALLVIHGRVERQVERQMTADLGRTRSVFESFMRERAAWLRAQCGVVAEDPRFTATLDIPSPQFDDQARTVIREAGRFQHIIGSDLFLVTDREGRVLARLQITTAPTGRLEGLATLGHALAGRPAATAWPEAGHARTLSVASVPIAEKGTITGTLSVGFLDRVEEGRLLDDLTIAARSPDVLSAARSGGARSVSGARDMLKAFEADFAALTDDGGRVTGLCRREAVYGEDQSSTPRVQAALMGHETQGMQVEGGQIAQMVVVPVWSGDEVIGTLAAGFTLDDRVARDLRDMMHSEVSFLRDGQIVASTWPDSMRRSLEADLPGRSAAAMDGSFLMVLGGERFLSLSGDLRDLNGRPSGAYLIQLSWDQAAAFLKQTERVLLLSGLGVMLAAVVISVSGASRITNPIKALVAGTRRLASGELGERIPVESRDEVGDLAQSFNEMAEALMRSRDALAESARQYRDLFDNAQDVVYTTGLDARVVSVNRAGLELLGYGAEELSGRSFYDLLDPGDAARLRALEEGLSAGAARPPVDVTLVGKAGRRASLEIVSRWIVEQGRCVGVHGIGRDVTERREREAATERFREQLHQAEKLRALGEMAAGVAHNFNNLLTGVMGYAEVMKLQAELPKEASQNADKIVEAARRCAGIIRRIQTFGRPMKATERETIHLHHVIKDTVDITRPKWKTGPEREGRRVDLVLDLKEIAPIQSSASVWEEILSNLIFNAVDAMPHGGRITIDTRMEDAAVVLAVSDTGTGMDEETRRRVFEPFFSTKGPDRGTGLGLSTVWALIHGQGGTVHLDTEPGRGTTFQIRLAAGRGTADASADEEDASAPGRLRVLVVDDEAPLRELVPTLLTGHDVKVAASGAEALQLAAREPFDVVLTDWVMAGMSGIGLAERVREVLPDATILLMTGWELSGSGVEGCLAVDAVLPKPFDAKRLRRAIHAALKGRAAAVVAGP